MDNNTNNFNKLLFHPAFNDTLAEINKLNIQLPPNPSDQEMDFHLHTYPQNGKLVSQIEDIKNYKLDSTKGETLAHSEITICAYDESLYKYSSLEGIAFLTSHSLIIHHKNDYLPSNLLTFHFYTRAKSLLENSKFIKYSLNPEADSKRDYVADRHKLCLL